MIFLDAIVKINDVSFKYSNNDEYSLKNISLSIEKGQYVALIGHNGSGKSTLAKLLMGLIEIQEGSINLFGLDLQFKHIYQIRSKLGVVFQNPDNQFIGSTVKEDIAFGLENHQVPTKEMLPIIEQYATYVDMLDFLDRDPSRLSGGQKQRIAIAGVLAMSPDLIIFDEATSMLDPIGKREIKALIKRINLERNTTVISITHDIEEAALADHIYVLNQGEIVLQGIPQEVFLNVDLLKSIYLDIPFIYKLNNELKVLGYQKNDFKDIEEAVSFLCQ